MIVWGLFWISLQCPFLIGVFEDKDLCQEYAEILMRDEPGLELTCKEADYVSGRSL